MIEAKKMIMNKYESNESNLKVLQAPFQICGLMTTFCNALNSIGIYAKSIAFIKHNYIKADVELDINRFTRDEKVAIRNKIFYEHRDIFDVFHFHFGHTLLYDQADLPYLVSKNKKLIMHHNGSDVRQLSICRKFNPYCDEMYKNRKTNDEELIKYIKNCSRWIETAIVQDVELLEYVKDYYENVEVLPLPLDLTLPYYSKLKESNSKIKSKIIKIIHAPTDRTVKGTIYVENAVRQLVTKGYNIEFKLIENMDHENLLSEISECDILVDQLLLGVYGMLAMEGMALGKPVVCYINDKVKEGYPNSVPIVSANPQNIEKVLESLILDNELRADLGKKGIEYVHKYHDLKTVILPRLLEIYNN